MKNVYIFEYRDENDFRKKERSVKKYNMLAYKKLIFEYYPQLREGKWLGDFIKIDSNNCKEYEFKLPTDELFKKVHGDIKLHYSIDENNRIIYLNDITPEVLLDGHRSDLGSYKGVNVSKSNSGDNAFKINLFDLLNK